MNVSSTTVTPVTIKTTEIPPPTEDSLDTSSATQPEDYEGLKTRITIVESIYSTPVEGTTVDSTIDFGDLKTRTGPGDVTVHGTTPEITEIEPVHETKVTVGTSETETTAVEESSTESIAVTDTSSKDSEHIPETTITSTDSKTITEMPSLSTERVTELGDLEATTIEPTDIEGTETSVTVEESLVVTGESSSTIAPEKTTEDSLIAETTETDIELSFEKETTTSLPEAPASSITDSPVEVTTAADVEPVTDISETLTDAEPIAHVTEESSIDTTDETVSEAEPSTSTPYSLITDDEISSQTTETPSTSAPLTSSTPTPETSTPTPETSTLTHEISTPTPEIDSDDESKTTPGTIGVPGEGDCMINGTSYLSGDSIAPTSSCEESCVCRDSVVVCKFKPCPPGPPAFLKCSTAELLGECCPVYDCREYFIKENLSEDNIHFTPVIC